MGCEIGSENKGFFIGRPCRDQYTGIAKAIGSFGYFTKIPGIGGTTKVIGAKI